MMAWTAPRTWVAEEVVTASVMNTHVRDNLGFLGTHGHSGAAGDGGTTLGTLAQITFSDAAASPAATGTLQRNGTNLEWHNGGSVVDIGGADAGAGTASHRSLGTGATQAAAGDHGHDLDDLTASNGGTGSGNHPSGAADAGAVLANIDPLATSTASISVTPSPAERSAYAVTAVFLAEGSSQAANARFSLIIDGTTVSTATGTFGPGAAGQQFLTGFVEVDSGARTAIGRIENLDATDTLRGGAWVSGIMIQVS